MGKAKTNLDMFLQFAGLKGRTDAVDTTRLTETHVKTGLSIRGQLVWLLHLVEEQDEVVPVTGVEGLLHWGVSTIQGLATMPSITDKGCVVRGRTLLSYQTTGMTSRMTPFALHYLPPVPVAAPELSLYVQMSVNHLTWIDIAVNVRLGFTTAPLDAAMYTEIAEVWGW